MATSGQEEWNKSWPSIRVPRYSLWYLYIPVHACTLTIGPTPCVSCDRKFSVHTNASCFASLQISGPIVVVGVFLCPKHGQMYCMKRWDHSIRNKIIIVLYDKVVSCWRGNSVESLICIFPVWLDFCVVWQSYNTSTCSCNFGAQRWTLLHWAIDHLQCTRPVLDEEHYQLLDTVQTLCWIFSCQQQNQETTGLIVA